MQFVFEFPHAQSRQLHTLDGLYVRFVLRCPSRLVQQISIRLPDVNGPRGRN